jgi:nucleoid-associated protein YgaU
MYFTRSNHQKPSETAKRAGKTAGKLALAGAMVATPALIATVPAHATNWNAVANCESNGNWHTSTGNGFYGGLQFTKSTWHANGGSGNPANASRAQQIRVAKNVKASQGMGAWPVCGSHGSEPGGSSSSGSSSSSSGASSAHSASSEQSTHHSVSHHHSTPSSHHSTPSSHHSSSTSHHHSSSSSHHSSSTSSSGGTYVVQSGDTLAKIANAHDVSGGWHHLYNLNSHKISDPGLIYPGQTLTL